MIENLLPKVKEGNNKKQIENIVIFIILLIIVIIVINSLFNDGNEVSKNIDVNEVITNKETNDELENKLKKTLSAISGVGEVDVMVSYANTITQVPMYNTKENTTTIEEQDVNGGKRATKEISNEQSIIFEEKNSTKIPAIKQTIKPEVIGVIVVADGANNQIIKENIKKAVEAIVNIASHRIQIFAR